MGRIKRQLAAEAAADGGRSISYEKGCGVASDQGVLEAILRTRGDYTDIKRVL
ncbi:MAG: hypothetical protein ACXW16_06605 [Burkholderiaceae bacterium]